MHEVNIKRYSENLSNKEFIKYCGEITKVTGLTIESKGPLSTIGEVCYVYPFNGKETILTEVVGFNEDKILLMPLGEMEGIGPGSRVEASGYSFRVNVGDELIGRILDGLGNPIDGKGPIKLDKFYPVNNMPPNPLVRQIISEPLHSGVKAIDGLLTCGTGQRIGIFSGSGVGKSTLMGMIARNAVADVNVIGLIGERGREVREFIENDLGEDGLKKSVVVIATSDQPALVRKKGALVTTAIAEYFRDKGNNVIMLMDSLTRFAMAQREIGLAIGEPPVTHGYPPSVFSIMPRLLERSGTSSYGSITGFYTVLVDGDDMNEPIADTVRGILDGHIVLSRNLAIQNHYPAIEVLQSISRVMQSVCSQEHIVISNKIKDIMATYKESEDLINIGAYKRGTNSKIDKAIASIDKINNFLTQDILEKFSYDETLELINGLIDTSGTD